MIDKLKDADDIASLLSFAVKTMEHEYFGQNKPAQPSIQLNRARELHDALREKVVNAMADTKGL